MPTRTMANLSHSIGFTKMLQAVQEQVSLLEEVFYALPESVYAKNKDGIYLSCSQRMAEMAGCTSPAEIIGKTDYDLIWRIHADELRANDLLVMNSKQPLTIEERGYTALNRPMVVRTIKSPLIDKSGEVVGVVGISFDVTDLLHNTEDVIQKFAADFAIERAESEFLKQWYYEISGKVLNDNLSLDAIGNRLKLYVEGIIDRLPANIYWMDLSGRMLGCNQQMASVLGCKNRQELIGQDTDQYYTGLNALEAKQNNLEAMEQEGVLIKEESATIEGEQKYFLSYKSILRDEVGEPMSLIGVSFDITERKKMEQELKQAKEEAEAANLAKLHFMNNMRHDLRTPLSCVVGSARVLKALETDPEKIEFIEGILNSSQHLLQMLTNMLEFDHIQSQEKSVKLTPVRIIKLGQDLIDMLQLTAKGKGLSLQLQVMPGMPAVIQSDAYRLQRILMNLLNNAIKFTHRGGVTLRMGLTEKGLQFSVIDTGIGIESTRQEEIFDKFVRLVESDKGLYEGEGLGLAIVKQFVLELEGKIELESEVGRGSRFTVFLPIATEQGRNTKSGRVDHEGIIGRRSSISS